MSSYRKRFVQFNMLLIGIVLTVMVAAVAVYMGRDYYNSLRGTMEQVVAPLRAFSQSPDGRPEKPGNPKDPGKEKDILTVFYSPEEESYTVLSHSDSIEEEGLPALLAAIVAQKQDFGVLKEARVFYYRTGSAPYKIAIASTSYLLNSIVNLGLVLLAVWAGGMGLFFLISLRLSAIAARPMEEAMEREKQFVADASHDLKTPLSVILANNAIMLENPEATAGELHRWLESTQSAAKRMQKLIGQMLTLADVERADAPLTLEDVDLASLAMRAELEVESLAYEKKVTLETELPDTCMVRGNADCLLRIVSSLMENALKYEPTGGTVILRLTREKKEARLSVQNLGSRILSEDLPHVFDRFYRSDRSRENASGSFGLGLAITKEMVERLGGRISVSSDEKTGTVFTAVFEHTKSGGGHS